MWAFYDHEDEEPRAGRRRRQVADWGVGEDVFDRLPSRRFSRAESAHARRADAAAAEPDAGLADAPSAPARPAADAPERSPRPEADARARSTSAPRPTRALGHRLRGRSARARPLRSAAPARAAAVRGGPVARTLGPRPTPRRRSQIARRGPPGCARDPGGGADDGRAPSYRRAARDYEPAARARPRRPRAPARRPAPGPIVAYAVGLGVLLILIAILSAGH